MLFLVLGKAGGRLFLAWKLVASFSWYLSLRQHPIVVESEFLADRNRDTAHEWKLPAAGRKFCTPNTVE
jgi:hypothetical protein